MPILELRGLQMYYELHGSPGADGQTQLVLLNGALDTIESDWGAHLPAFAERYRVLAYDHRGHGRTSGSPEAFASYGVLADDLAALLDALDIGQAHFCGFSDGGITLLALCAALPCARALADSRRRAIYERRAHTCVAVEDDARPDSNAPARLGCIA